MIASAASRNFFVAFAFVFQLALVLDFAARHWRPDLERRYGWIVYALGIPGLILAGLCIVTRETWNIWAAPVVFAAWAGFGYMVDVRMKIPWRSPPRWPIFIAYVILFLAAQFLFWIPLWTVGISYWIGYTALYVLNTVLNITSHRR